MSRAYIGTTKPTGNAVLTFQTPPDSLLPKVSTVEISPTGLPNGSGSDTFESTSGATKISIKARNPNHTVYVEYGASYFTISPGQSYNIDNNGEGLPNTEFTLYSEDSGCVAEIIEWY